MGSNIAGLGHKSSPVHVHDNAAYHSGFGYQQA